MPALTELIHNNTIRIIELVFIKNDAEGNFQSLEIYDLDDDEGSAFDDRPNRDLLEEPCQQTHSLLQKQTLDLIPIISRRSRISSLSKGHKQGAA